MHGATHPRIILFPLRICSWKQEKVPSILILSKIREQYPEYKKELGILYISMGYSSPDLIYKENEISDAPYPGIEKFIKDRLTREPHFGKNSRIGIDGYEKP